jgi:nitric oxide reductase NorE protein
MNDRRLPGDADIWVMVLGDLFIFGCYLVVYMVFRAMSLAEFANAQRHLNLDIGVLNTIVLLTSSLFIALGVIAVRDRAMRTAERLFLGAGACGVLFALLKVYEWHQEVARGFTMQTEFFSFYFIITGVHLAHLVLGLLVLGIAIRELRAPGRQRVEIVEQCALYWHMVDLLWVVIFAVLYLMR